MNKIISLATLTFAIAWLVKAMLTKEDEERQHCITRCNTYAAATFVILCIND